MAARRPETKRLELTSPAFAPDGALPERCARDRSNVSPPLNWSGVPRNAVELVLVCQDIDVPGGFTHWVLAGIAPSTTGVAEGTTPAGAVLGVNDFSEAGWTGPQPAAGQGSHRYLFIVSALALAHRLPPRFAVAEVLRGREADEVACGELVGVYPA